MNYKTVALSAGLALLIVFAGAQFFLFNDSQERVKPYPAKPEVLNESSVTEYAVEYESVYKYNEQVKRYKRDDELDYLLGIETCEDRGNDETNAWFKKETNAGFYVFVYCPIDLKTKGSQSGSMIHEASAYFINQNSTVRVGLGGFNTGERIVNFDDKDHKVNITVQLNTTPPKTVFSKEYDVASRSMTELDNVTKNKGVYEIEVSVDNNSKKYEWRASETGNVFENMRIYINPYGDFVVIRTPEESR